MQPNVEMYFSRILKRVAAYLPAQGRLLDVGCAEGDDAVLLRGRGCEVLGVDIEEHALAWAKRRTSGLDFQAASAEALPFPAASFDAVWAKDALHHMEHPAQALQECLRVAKPGAPVIVVEANRFNPVFYLHMTLMEGHEHFSRRTFRKMLQQADPRFKYFMLESRCLPWQAEWILKTLEHFENTLEQARILEPWLTYQVGILSGSGQKV